MRVLSRTWQMLLKGITEVEESGRPLAAAEMVLVRLAYAADLPDARRSDPVARRQRLRARRAPPGMAARHRRRFRLGPAPRFEGARSDAPRGAPRGCARDGAADGPPWARRGGQTQVLAVDSFEGLIALAVQKRDSRSRPRSNATCGWCDARTGGSTSRSSRAP
jgi:DNA polymerase-3 subunit gamma/tau